MRLPAPAARALLAASAVALGATARPALALDPAKRITQYGHDVWQIEQGLPHNSIRAITQTADGYLWLGTLEGLVRFDGVRFTVFDRDSLPALRDSGITALMEDRSGTLWIGTEGGLLRHRDGAFEAYGEDRSDPVSVTALAEGLDGTIWVGAQVTGVYQATSGALVPCPGLSAPANRTISALHVDRLGRLWVGSRTRGVASLHQGTIREYRATDGLLTDDVRAFTDAPDGALWIALDKGLTRLGPDGRLESLGVAGGVRALRTDRHGSLWIGTNDDGVTRLANGTRLHYSKGDGLSSLSVRTFFEDREGSLWVGLVDGGLNRFRDGPITTIGEAEGLTSEVVIGLAADPQGGVWAGTRSGGLHLIRGDAITRLTTKEGLSSDTVVSIASDAQGTLWAGTIAAGLNRIAGRAVRTFRTADGLAHDDVFALQDDGRGGLWVGTRGGGLNHLEGSRFASYGKAQGLASSFVWDLARDAAGTLWIASARGLYALSGGVIRRVVPDIPAHALHVDRDGVVWVGTAMWGLYRVQDGRATAFTTRQGLQNDNVTQVLEDEQEHLWLGSNRGLSRVSKRQLEDLAAGRIERITPVSYDSGDGMRGRECNYGRGTRTSDGRLWFPTIRGVAVVDPARIQTNAIPPPVHVERVIANGQDAVRGAAGSPAAVPPGEGRLEFHFTALSYLAPGKVRFSHRLEGFDAGWSEPDARRETTYTNLPPGRYTFRVKACNNDGVWNEAGASFAVDLRPHFYETAWFAALVAAALAALAWRIHLFRAQRLVEMERVRTRIAADLHDDIGSGLSQIAVLSEVVSRQLRPEGPPIDALGRIAATAGELVDSMSDIVWAVNPHNDGLEDLVRRMRGFANDVGSARDVQVRFQATGVDGQKLGPDVRRHVYLIFKEAVNNAARHSGGEHIDVALAVRGGRLSLRVADDGRGFDRSRPSEGNGLTTMTRRAAELGGRAEITCPPGGGTVLTMDVPLGR